MRVLVRSVAGRAMALAVALTVAQGFVPTVADPAPAGAAAERRAAAITVPGSLTGYAFDACAAPSQQQMDAWWQASPYAGVGIYIGGVQRRCAQPNLDAAWVRRQHRTGWHILPIYVGRQASCSGYQHRMSDDRATALAQGRRAAVDALKAARSLGIARGSTLYYDLEDYDISGDRCRRAALSFLSGWTKELHAAAFDSGVYSSLGAAITSLDYADRVSPGTYAMPDDIWFAWANGRADTATDDRVLSDRWDRHARIHQYKIDVTKSFGGVELDIDVNFLDVGRGSVAPSVSPTCGVDVDLRRYPRLTRGGRGAAVSAGQCLLRQGGFGRLDIDGRFDQRTERAVRSAQRAFGLPTSGALTAATWTALLSAGSRPLLKVGSTGEAVRHLQRALTAATGRPVPVSGVFTKQTATAVTRYQRALRLQPTGVANRATWSRLQSGSTAD